MEKNKTQKENNSNYLIKLGNKIRQLRIEKGMTQTDLAAKVGKDYQSIQRVEHGTVNSSIQYLREIAEGLEMTTDELIKNIENGG